MKSKKGRVLLLWLLVCPGVTGAIVVPFSISSALGIAMGFIISCQLTQWSLKMDLENKLFGQHLASRIILKAVSEFMSNDNPKKPLVLSLHGPSGTGKNFVSQLIAENIYKEGMSSKFVHVFTSTLHFQNPRLLFLYKYQLQQWIKDSVSNCERSMFIFDEMDKMDPGLIDSIQPYLEYYGKVVGVSYRKSIFIFLSNAGGEIIVQTALDFWRARRDRKEIDLKDLKTSVSLSIFNNHKSDSFCTTFIYENLVDYFVPFLPLEYSHVVQCAMAEMKTRASEGDGTPDLNVAKQVAHDWLYFPKQERVFAVKGCKTIESKLDQLPLISVFYDDHMIDDRNSKAHASVPVGVRHSLGTALVRAGASPTDFSCV
uniref:AAA+ ATPase domain-containing protein n=1 Tax=Oryzias latipes TaxID=8090 RepID=A0A3P9JL74_ORYLA